MTDCTDDSKKYQAQKHETGEILVDKSSTGRIKPWNSAKQKSKAVSQAFKFAGEDRLSERVFACGHKLWFGRCPNGHASKLISAEFCNVRICPMCQWRKSGGVYYQVNRLSLEHLKRRKSDIALFLTFTVPNCSGIDLPTVISRMNKGWNRLLHYKKMKGFDGKSIFQSWFRSLETSYSEFRNDYHPHFHALVFVRERYFKKSSGEYIDHDTLLKLWQKAMQDDSITQVDIRKIYVNENRSEKDSDSAEIIHELNHACGEVAKYATKQSSYIKYSRRDHKYVADPDVIMNLHNGLKNKRLLGFGGLFKEIKVDLNMQDFDSDNADLVSIGDDPRTCCSICNERYELYQANYNEKHKKYIS